MKSKFFLFGVLAYTVFTVDYASAAFRQPRSTPTSVDVPNAITLEEKSRGDEGKAVEEGYIWVRVLQNRKLYCLSEDPILLNPALSGSRFGVALSSRWMTIGRSEDRPLELDVNPKLFEEYTLQLIRRGSINVQNHDVYDLKSDLQYLGIFVKEVGLGKAGSIVLQIVSEDKGEEEVITGKPAAVMLKTFNSANPLNLNAIKERVKGNNVIWRTCFKYTYNRGKVKRAGSFQFGFYQNFKNIIGVYVVKKIFSLDGVRADIHHRFFDSKTGSFSYKGNKYFMKSDENDLILQITKKTNGEEVELVQSEADPRYHVVGYAYCSFDKSFYAFSKEGIAERWRSSLNNNSDSESGAE